MITVFTWTYGEMAFNMICSFTASILFLFFILIFLKPSITISPVISICVPEFEGKEFYIFKIVNRSYFSAYDVNMELYLVQTYASPPSGKLNNRYTKLVLKLNDISHLPNRPLLKGRTADYAIRFKTEEDLSTILKDPANSIEIRVKLKHGLTGLSKVYGYQYCDLTEIKKGKFAHGKSFEIL